MVILKEPFLGWQSNYKGSLKSSWTGGSAPLLCCSLCIHTQNTYIHTYIIHNIQINAATTKQKQDRNKMMKPQTNTFFKIL
jgi:hypothetical protein